MVKKRGCASLCAFLSCTIWKEDWDQQLPHRPDSTHQVLVLQIPPLGLDRRRLIVASP